MEILDISLPITNEMWSYKVGWENSVNLICSTLKSDLSTVYRFSLCSHSGTYIETSQHKLRNNILLDDFEINRFFCDVKLLKLDKERRQKCIFLPEVLSELKKNNLTINSGDCVIISCGWAAEHHKDKEFISSAPYFEEKLTNYLATKKLNLLGVDTPVIDYQPAPYFAINKLFKLNKRLLILAPLSINHDVNTGTYLLNTLPLKIENVSACLCRPILIKNIQGTSLDKL